MSKTTNVTVGKPAVGGAIYRAPIGTALPTSATETLNKAFVSLGYISSDGMTNSNTWETSTEKAWGGDVVNSLYTGKTDSFKQKFIESMNVDVLKLAFGDDNVSGDLEKGIVVKANATEPEAASYVCDMILKGGYLKRIVIPYGQLTSLGDITYGDSTSTGYDTTITASPDDAENTHYEYIAAKTTTTTGEG